MAIFKSRFSRSCEHSFSSCYHDFEGRISGAKVHFFISVKLRLILYFILHGSK